MRWHFIPTETFPRKGLTIKEMTEPQRKLAHDLLKAGLSQRGYLTASSIMDLETVLGALEAAQRAAADAAAAQRAARPRSGALLLLGLRHAVGEGHLGLARRRASRLAALHGRERHAGRGLAVVLRLEPGGSARGPEEGAATPRRRRGRRARARRLARRDAAHEGDLRRHRAERHGHDGERQHHAAVADRPRRGRDDAGAARSADEADRRLHREDGGRHRRRSAGAS